MMQNYHAIGLACVILLAFSFFRLEPFSHFDSSCLKWLLREGAEVLDKIPQCGIFIIKWSKLNSFSFHQAFGLRRQA